MGRQCRLQTEENREGNTEETKETAQSGRGEHLTLPSHTTLHAGPHRAVHEDAQTTLMA
jgi:hypothetical protein